MADKCTPVRSSWLTHIGTYGGKFFACFRNGFCCIYPNSDETYYDIAMSYASKGHFLHQWLYKILPYLPIKNPCPAILAPPAPGPGPTCPTAGTVTLSGTYGASGNGAVDQWWTYPGLPTGVYTGTFAITSAAPSNLVIWEGTCAALLLNTTIMGTGTYAINHLNAGSLFVEWSVTGPGAWNYSFSFT